MLQKETEEGIDLSLLFLLRLEVKQTPALHKPRLAESENESQEQGNEE